MVKKSSKKTVASKRLNYRPEDEGFPVSALREISLLHKLQHKNIVRFLGVATASSSQADRLYSCPLPAQSTSYSYPWVFFMMCEYAEHSLKGLLDRKVAFTPAHVNYIMRQILEGVAYMHGEGVMHRDVKCSNILLNADGEVKLADFGMARQFNAGLQISRKPGEPIATLWYRAPELLLGAQYNEAVDLWAVGCVFAELLTGSPLFPGKNEDDQLLLLAKALGLPNDTQWPELSALPKYCQLKAAYKKLIGESPATSVGRLIECHIGCSIRAE